MSDPDFSDSLPHGGAPKAEWRRAMKALRADLAARACPADTQAQLHHLAASIEWQSAIVVASYLAFGSEYDPRPLDAAAREAGKRVVYPRVRCDGGLSFHQWSPDQPLDSHALGMREPSADAITVDPVAIDLVLIPLLACDHHGHRLGYGGGFYDRALANCPGFRCGVGFADQLVPALPHESHDATLDGFLSAQGLVRFREGAYGNRL